jgi:predicted lipid-binding transport protein (Tim44 family)
MAKSRTMTTKKQRTTTEQPATAAATAPIADLDAERLTGRLAEMVTALSECESSLAIDAVRAILATGQQLDALEVVAMALIAVKARQRGQLRVPGYVRPDDPSRTVTARRAARRARPATTPADRGSEPEGVVVDLRAEHAHLHLDLTRPEVR